MIYVTSDLHGYSIEKILAKLSSDEINFGENDHLYVLGDCVDRGRDGIEIIRWIMRQPNVTLLLGNHEAMMLENRHLFEFDQMPDPSTLLGERRKAYSLWTSNGGYATCDALEGYTTRQIKYIFDFVEKAPLYKEVEVNGKKYILTHSGLGSFEEEKPLSEYSQRDLVWSRPSLETQYYKDGRMVVFGHTPTIAYGSKFKNRVIFEETWIDIDTGAAIDLSPALLRLDDLKVFYF